MKKSLFIVCICLLYQTAMAQPPSEQEKLYYTCKIWGFAKYFHSEVSMCHVNWDSVLIDVLPEIHAATSSTQFNDALINMLNAAGPMALSTTYFPDTLPAELKRNRDFSWFSSPVLRADVRTILDTIRNNFRPHASCQVEYAFSAVSTNWGGYLKFPVDTLMLNTNTTVSLPDQDHKLLMCFKMWNIARYFNPYNYVLDVPWDTTLFHNAPYFASAANRTELCNIYLRTVAALDDAHVQGLSYCVNAFVPPGYYLPRLRLKYIGSNCVVVRSMEPGIYPGDILTRVDGVSTFHWEADSLMPYYSAGNPSVLRRCVAENLLYRQSPGTIIHLEVMDSLHATHPFNVATYNPNDYPSIFQGYYYPADSLDDLEWTIFDCNVGYMNFGNLTDAGTDAAYAAMSELPAIIIDIRNYPLSANAWGLSSRMYPDITTFAKLSLPQVNYPGTYRWEYQSAGIAANPTPYNGRIVVIVDETTQSAAEYTTMMLQQMPDCIVVGSQTAGADGNVTWLGVSQDIRFGWTSLSVYYPNGDSTQRIGIVPDSLAYPTTEGVRHHRDYVLEKAMAIAGCSTGIKPVPASFDLLIYPNPAEETVTVKITQPLAECHGTIAISDISGRVMHTGQIACSGGTVTGHIDISKFAAGLYFAKVQIGDRSVVRKLVVAHTP